MSKPAMKGLMREFDGFLRRCSEPGTVVAPYGYAVVRDGMIHGWFGDVEFECMVPNREDTALWWATVVILTRIYRAGWCT